ncbi:hypothetical protein [Portibacter lacus]|uniref:Uncharacterized protein n=1 Tax=Portibacter lacus TaxID=1099794 RepID=A0AA37WGF2_9BACT|nr:hypothetical protein [Portibacter lacus]GLR19797.1 hypothetical protein GCM10007940_44130 [Portibacter lacus]
MQVTFFKLGLFSILVFVATNLLGQSQSYSEGDYSDYIQELIGGEREYSVESGRIDLLTEEYAFEIDWRISGRNR